MALFNRIALIMAMEDEAKPIIHSLNLEHRGFLLNPLPMQYYTGVFHGVRLDMVTSGKCSEHDVDHIGPQAAVLNAATTIGQLQPDLIINAGTAGGFIKAGGTIGDVYLSYPMVCFHDRRIPLPGFDSYGVGSYQCVDTREMASELGLKTGVVSTGSSLDFTEKDLELMESYGAVVKEMEAASIAWVSNIYKTPFFAIKAITDLVDSNTPTEEDFLLNLKSASEALSIETIRIINYLAGK